MLLIASTFFTLYMFTDTASLEEKDIDFIDSLRVADRYTNAFLYTLLMVALVVVDVLLLKRLKTLYPSFFKKQRNKVGSLTI